MQVHEFEQLEQEGFKDDVVFYAEEFYGVDFFEEDAGGDADILRCNEIYNTAYEYIAV